MPASDHGAILLRVGNVVFARFGDPAADASTPPALRTCRSCLHWSPDQEAPRGGRCLADCGARIVAADGRCRAWRQPPLLTVV